MLDPRTQTGKTLSQLMLDLAEAVGLVETVDPLTGANVDPRVPTDSSRQSVLRRAVNNGYQAFLSAYPAWTFLEATWSVQLDPTGLSAANVAGDAGRYRLPGNMGSTLSRVLITDGAGVRQSIIDVTTPQRVATLWADQTRIGWPVLAAVRPLVPTPAADDTGPSWELILAPRPVAVGQAQATVRLSPRPLVNLTDRHIAGQEHDRTIVLMAIMEHARADEPDAERFARYERAAMTALSMSIEVDKRMQPATLGVMNDPELLADQLMTVADVRRSQLPGTFTYLTP